MKGFLVTAALFLAGYIGAAPALAGIADSPLPVLEAGKPTFHLYSVPGVMAFNDLHTYFACTSTDTATMRVGVERFFAVGGAPTNDAAATSLSVGPGATVIFGTADGVEILTNSNLGGFFTRGSARILATSRKLACTAFIADPFNAPPGYMLQLTQIIAKTKQKAAN